MNAPERMILDGLLQHTAFHALHAKRDKARRYWSAQHDALLELQRRFNDRTEAERKAIERERDSFDADDGPNADVEGGQHPERTLNRKSREAKLCRPFNGSGASVPSTKTLRENATPKARRNARGVY